MNFFSIELHNVWSASSLNVVACPFFISALVPDLHFRVLHWAAPLFMVLSGLNFSPLCAYVLGSQLCDAFCLSHAFRPSILVEKHKKWCPRLAHYENVKQNQTKIPRHRELMNKYLFSVEWRNLVLLCKAHFVGAQYTTLSFKLLHWVSTGEDKRCIPKISSSIN